MFTATFAGFALLSMGGSCGPYYIPAPPGAPYYSDHGPGIVVQYVLPRISPYNPVYHPPVLPVLPKPKDETPKKKGL